jgi:magnesium-transporting ATPase (P-type)
MILTFIDQHGTIVIHDMVGGSSTKKFFKRVAIIPFTSARKMSSVIVRDKFNNYVMYTKGADSKIEEVLSENSRNEDMFNFTRDRNREFSE